MERSKAKEAGRKKTIREKANALKDKPPRKAPTKEVIKQAGRFHAIEAARKQLSEAQQAIAPDQEQQPYTAVDKVETYSANAAHEVLQALPSAGRPSQHPDNPFHRETDFREKKPRKPKPQEQMLRGINATTQKYATGYRSSSSKALPSVQTAGQRQMALPRNASPVSTSKAQLVKEQGRRYARNQAIQEIKTGTMKNLSGKASKASGDFFKKLGTAVTKAVTPSKETLLYAAGALVLILIPFMAIIGLASMLSGSDDSHGEAAPLSAEVEEYRPYYNVFGRCS